MKSENGENLKELFERFFEPEEAQKAVEDIRQAKQILRENPAPQPDERLIAEIKYDIAMRLQGRQKQTFRRLVFETAAIAAAIIIFIGISTKIFERRVELGYHVGYPTVDRGTPEVAIIPTAVWTGEDVTVDDLKLAAFTAEADEIKNELVALRWGKGESNGEAAVEELELEMLEMENDFWKG